MERRRFRSKTLHEHGHLLSTGSAQSTCILAGASDISRKIECSLHARGAPAAAVVRIRSRFLDHPTVDGRGGRPKGARLRAARHPGGPRAIRQLPEVHREDRRHRAAEVGPLAGGAGFAENGLFAVFSGFGGPKRPCPTAKRARPAAGRARPAASCARPVARRARPATNCARGAAKRARGAEKRARGRVECALGVAKCAPGAADRAG